MTEQYLLPCPEGFGSMDQILARWTQQDSSVMVIIAVHQTGYVLQTSPI